MKNTLLPSALVFSMAILSGCNAESPLSAAQIEAEYCADGTEINSDGKCSPITIDAKKESDVSKLSSETKKPVKLNVKDMNLKEGVAFDDAAMALLNTTVLREDPDNFYEKIMNCRVDNEQEGCRDLLDVLDAMIERYDSERAKHNLDLVISRIKFILIQDPDVLENDYLTVGEPVGEPRIIEGPKSAPGAPGEIDEKEQP